MSQLSSHSADVKMWLDCGEYGRVDLSRVTPKSVVATQVREIPPCFAELVVAVDGDLQRTPVNLPSGFTKGRLVAFIQRVTESTPF